jgi:hypothetical protein
MHISHRTDAEAICLALNACALPILKLPNQQHEDILIVLHDLSSILFRVQGSTMKSYAWNLSYAWGLASTHGDTAQMAPT